MSTWAQAASAAARVAAAWLEERREPLAGLLLPNVQRLLRQFEGELRIYFKRLARDVLARELEDVYNSFAPPEDEPVSQQQVVLVKGVVREMMLGPVQKHQPLLLQALAVSLQRGYLESWKEAGKLDLVEAFVQEQQPFEHAGPALSEASAYAAVNSARLVRGIDEYTRERMAEVVAGGIRDKLGVDGTGRAIRRTLDGFSVARARRIALTEMNDAVSEAALQRFHAKGFAGKRTRIGFDACTICVANHEAGTIPVAETFPSGHQRPPFHPSCRDVLLPARLGTGGLRPEQFVGEQAYTDMLGTMPMSRNLLGPSGEQRLRHLVDNNVNVRHLKDSTLRWMEGGDLGPVQTRAAELVKSGEALVAGRSTADDLLLAVRNSPTRPDTAWRGMSFLEGDAIVFDDLAVGNTWQTGELASWSYTKEIAQEFGAGQFSPLAGIHGARGIVLEVRGGVKGYNASAMGDLFGELAFDQDELITNGMFKVVEVTLEEYAGNPYKKIVLEQTGVL